MQHPYSHKQDKAKPSKNVPLAR